MHSVFMLSWLIGVPLSITVVLVAGFLAEKVGLHLSLGVSLSIGLVIFAITQWFLTRMMAMGYEQPVKSVKAPNLDARRRAAAAAREVLTTKRKWNAFAHEFSDSNDPLIDELYDLLEHEPGTEGIGGVTEAFARDYRRQIEQAIANLEKTDSERMAGS